MWNENNSLEHQVFHLCFLIGLGAAISAHKLVRLGREAARWTNRNHPEFCSQSWAPHHPSTSMTSILLKTCSFTVIFRPLPYVNHHDFQELLTYLKILEKNDRIWPHLLQAFSRNCLFIKWSGENVRAIANMFVVSGIQKDFDFPSF